MPDSLRHGFEFALAHTALRTFGALPRNWALRLGAGLGAFARSPLRVRLPVVETQIAEAFPERDTAWVRATARACYRHFGREAAEIVRLDLFGQQDLLDRIRGADEAKAAFRSEEIRGLGAVIVTGHLGNWEAAGAAVSQLGMPLAAVVKRQSNARFDDLLVQSRRRLGIEPIYMEEARARMPDLIRSGVSVALVADQDARNRGIFVPFLGRPASTFRGPARLALDTGAPLFFGAAIREGEGYRAIVEPVRTARGGPDAERELTRGWVERLEYRIRLKPEQYFWFHRRWKTVPDVADEPPNRPTGTAETHERY
ncbi:MAG: lysophospholipid acyltransferase family protein [marine benthic group bacterium]|nr:lysophospholipid acyltransferase family protein [Candidatus Carthagonibacter metallireducens]